MLTADVEPGQTMVEAAAAAFTAGDLLLLYQAQGARIDVTNSRSYGEITDLQDAGRSEFVRVKSTDGSRLTLTSPVQRRFAATRTQLVKVVEADQAELRAGDTLVPNAWDGRTGGILALRVKGRLRLEGTIDASGKGFRGGQLDNESVLPGKNDLVSPNPSFGAEKGESIAGDARLLDKLGGRYGRGAPANGGGGGNSHNAGGGGGANLLPLTVGSYDGLGIPLMNPGFALDPELSLRKGGFGVGGGRGGYTYSQNNADAWVTPPNDVLWGGDRRRCVGGLGGHPLPLAGDEARLFFGGGGGAGDANQYHGGAGGPGGGLVILIADEIDGAGRIVANGGAGESAFGFDGDAPGGGGGGGTIVIWTKRLGAALTVQADGGVGGNQDQVVGFESEGPGGGGGGGAVLFVDKAFDITTPAGGLAGTSNAAGVKEFQNNGATGGGAGRRDVIASTLLTGTAVLVPLWKVEEPTAAADAGMDVAAAAAAPGVDAGADAAVGVFVRIDAEVVAQPSSPTTNQGPITAPTPAASMESGAGNSAAPDAGVDAASTDAVRMVTVTGGACSVSGQPQASGWFWLMAAMVALRVRKWRLVVEVTLVVLLFVNEAGAASDSLEVERFALAPEGTGVLDVPGDLSLSHGQGLAHLGLGYANNPLVLRDAATHDELATFVKNRAGMLLSLGLGVGGRGEVLLQMPVILHQQRDMAAPGSPPGFASSGWGDARMLSRWRLWRDQRWRLVLGLGAALPSARAHSFMGETGLRGLVDISLAYTTPSARTILDFGYVLRQELQLLDLRVDDEIALRLGQAIALGTQRNFEVQLSAAAFRDVRGLAAAGALPVSAHAGIAGNVRGELSWLLGAGIGLSYGWGIPDGRLFAGLRFQFDLVRPERDALADIDLDSIADTVDTCPNIAEDRDRFRDEDGCPEPDNDGDGILDGHDACPRLAENRNGWQDADGCPDVGQEPAVAALVPETACEARSSEVVTVSTRLAALAPVHFGIDEDMPLAESLPVLAEVESVLKDHPEIKLLRVEGHTDSDGDNAYNDDLSRRRLTNIANYLVLRGIAKERLTTGFHGERAPASDNQQREGRAFNRRVTFSIERMAP